jgi:chromosome segregation ATPase
MAREICSLGNQHQQIQAGLQSELLELRETYARLNEDYQEAEAQLGHERKAFQTQKSANKRQEEEIDHLQTKLSEVEKRAQEWYATERARLSKRFEPTIAKLKEQMRAITGRRSAAREEKQYAGSWANKVSRR